MSTQNCAVQVKIELGHRATVKKIRSPEGFTHDWTVYVRGPENCNISYFIEKVVFNLHGSFHNPKRVLTEPPYAVQEQGYAGFELPIDIYFKNKEEPRKIRFKYDLFLKLEDCPPVNHIRCEKLTFQNPTDEFKKKLLKAGGVLVGPSGEPLVPMGEFTEIFDAPISLDSSKRPPKSSHIPSKEKTSKEKSSSSSKLSSKTSATHGVSSSTSKDSLSTEERKEKRSPKEASQQKRPHDTSSTDGVLMKKPKRHSSVSSPPEVKVKEKHRSSEKKRHSKERDGSKSSKDPHKDHHKREMDSQEKDSRERDKEKFEKMKREHKEREGKKEILKHKSSSSVTNSPNPLAFKSHSAEKKDKHGSKNLSDSVKREKVKKSESSHSRKENKEEKSSSSSKSSSLSVDKKVKEIVKSLSKALDTPKRPSMATPESAPPKKKPRVEELFSSSSSSSEDSSEDEDEEVVKEIIEGVEKNKDSEESSDSSSSCDSELDEKVLNVWSSQSVSKLSPLSQHKISTKSPSSIKNPSSHKSVRSISPAASERSWSSKYSPTGSTHSHTSTSNRHSSSKQSTKEKDISKHSKESKSKKSSSKSSSHSSSSEKKDKETSSRSDKHISKKSSTPNVFASEKTDKHSRSHSKDRSKLEKNPMDKKPKDVKLVTDMKSEKSDSVPQSFEKNEWKENIYKSEVSQEKFTNIKSEKVRSFSIESNDQMCLKKEFLSDDEESDKKENVAETFNFENGYGHLGTAPNGEDLIELLKLHQKLESMQDRSVIQRVVQEIEKTGLYKISEKTFDFDLCELDSSTVKKIHNFLCSV